MARLKETKYVCSHCGAVYNDTLNFYKSSSTLYEATGCLPICKDCFKQQLNVFINSYADKRKAMQRMCMAFDLFYSDSIFEKCKDDNETFVGNYIKKLNMSQFRNKSFESDLDNGFIFGQAVDPEIRKAENPEDERIPGSPKIKKVDIEKWGAGFDPEDYEVLNAHYKYLKNANPNCDSNQEIFINDLCMTKMMQGRAAKDRRIDDYNKLTESYRKSFKDAGLKTVQDESTVNEDCWSLWTSNVSQYTPEEYYKNKLLYKDMDGFDEYRERHVDRPLNNIINGTDIRDEEFYIHEDEDES